MIAVIRRQGLWLLFDTCLGTYRWASASAADARATIPRAQASPRGDWLDNTKLAQALALCEASGGHPDMKKHMGTISKWGIVWWPKYKSYVIVGERSAKIAFVTSTLIALHRDNGTLTAETQNSRYELRGEPDHEAAHKSFMLRYEHQVISHDTQSPTTERFAQRSLHLAQTHAATVARARHLRLGYRLVPSAADAADTLRSRRTANMTSEASQIPQWVIDEKQYVCDFAKWAEAARIEKERHEATLKDLNITKKTLDEISWRIHTARSEWEKEQVEKVRQQANTEENIR
jgi:hypothetical protein